MIRYYYLITASLLCGALSGISAAAQVTAPVTSQKQTVQQVDIALVKCQGNSKAQTVMVTMLLTNTGPTRDLQFEQVRAIDEAGNEYKTFAIAIGTGGIRNKLVMGVPIKAVAVISKITAASKQFKLLACPVYNAEQPGRTLDVDFRDVTVNWK